MNHPNNPSDNEPNDIAISQQFREALARHELQIYYQPTVDSQTKQIVGVEALLRWHHPTLGVIMPDVFIPIAHKTDLIISITEWILMSVCQQHRIWKQANHNIYVAVNVTAPQFEAQNFSETVAQVLRQTDMDPGYLKIEITEELALKAGGKTENLRRLSEMGIEVMLDDFGKGYSSLGYLQSEHIRFVKIDKLLIQGIGSDSTTSERSQMIIKAIVELAQSLDIKTIAEGVESEEQFEFLKQIGCEIVQGYLFGKPMFANELIKHLSKLS